MKSFLDPEGMFDPSLRFAFTNITDEDFTSAWDGHPVTIKAGESVEVPQYLAVKFTHELVDKIMLGEVKANEDEYYKKNRNAAVNSYRAPNSIGVPAARKPWEDKILKQLVVDEDSPQVQIIRMQVKAELEADMSKQPSTTPPTLPTSIEEFADLDKTNQAAASKPATKAPLNVPKAK